MYLKSSNFLSLGVFTITLLMKISVSESVYTVDTTRFASKNAYVSSTTGDERTQAKSTLDIINKYCKALQVSSVLRHGTRNPSTGDINNINSVLQKFQATGSNISVLQDLAEVVTQFPMSTQGQLIQTGVLEHNGLGYRMADNFANLLGQAGLDELSFSATSVTRTIDSCNAFQEGFFEQHNRPIVAPITIRDDILRFYDTCDAYQELEANSSSQIQSLTYQNMTFQAIIQDYLNDIQLPSVSVTYDEMNSIYQVGAIEYAAFNTTYWAEYINPQDMLSLEYFSDLEQYYKLGYGYEINYDMSCPLVSTLFHDMDKVFNGSNYLKGLFYFAHAETVGPLFDVMGLYKDSQPLTASNYDQQTNRQFRTGRIIPFATNIAFVQYDCDVQSIISNFSQIPVGIFPSNPQRNMTLMLAKEAPIKFPLCEALVCPYSTVRQFYSQYIDNCNYNLTCDNFPTSSASMIFTRNSLAQQLFVAVCLIYAFGI